MIDISQEQLLPLAEAAELLPPRRNGSRPHATTLHRWARHGLKDVRLEVLLVGDTTCTSLPAMQRFFERLTEKALAVDEPSATPSQRMIGVDQALDDLGI